MFYGFKKSTGKCVWSIDVKPTQPDGVVILESEIDYDIGKVCLGGTEDAPTIDAVIMSEEEKLANEKSKRDYLLNIATAKVGVLADVVEFANTEESEANLEQWRKYRVELYRLDFTDLDNIKWPTEPAAY